MLSETAWTVFSRMYAADTYVSLWATYAAASKSLLVIYPVGFFDAHVERVGLLFDSGAEEGLWREQGGGDSSLTMGLRALQLHNESNGGILPWYK